MSQPASNPISTSPPVTNSRVELCDVCAFLIARRYPDSYRSGRLLRGRALVEGELCRLGPITRGERIVLSVFALTHELLAHDHTAQSIRPHYMENTPCGVNL